MTTTLSRRSLLPGGHARYLAPASAGIGGPSFTAAARLVRRAGFGATGAQVEEAARLGPSAWVDRELAGDNGPVAEPKLPQLPTRPNVKEVREAAAVIISGWVSRMLTAPHPIHEKLLFGWHDHFATAIQKVRKPHLMVTQLETMRRLRLGPFPDLMHAMAIDPAMLDWLDGIKNTRQAPNENLAREVMELFCLGVDQGYTETDVKEGARALTGWQIDDQGTARFNPKRHDTGRKTVLGVTGTLDAKGFIDAVLAQPRWRTHVAERWWRRLASSDFPSADVAARLASSYGPRGEVGPMVRAVLLDPAFQGVAGTFVVPPLEWLVGAGRSLRVPASGPTLTAIVEALPHFDHVPLDPPDVAGWPIGRVWATTSAAGARASIVPKLVASGDISPVAQASQHDRVDACCHLLGIPALTTRSRDALASVAGDPPRLVAAALMTPEYLVH